jgi:acetyltransferase-like isoleucine patch superfamily enzyme
MLKIILIILSLPKSILFNLRNLPFMQAIKMPIFVKYDTKVHIHHGKIILQNNQIKTAMIRIGFHEVPTKDVHRAILNIKGELIFLGSAHIGCGSIIHVAKKSKLILGDNFAISACSTINCYKQISFGKDIQFSWDCLVMDCDTHTIYDELQNIMNEPKEISFGDHIWIGCGVTILKGANIPSNCVIAAHSVVTSKQYEASSIIAGSPSKSVKKIGGWKL